jgi:hypothetical protein
LQVKESPVAACSCYEEDKGGAGETASFLGTTAGTSTADLSVILPTCSLGDNSVTHDFLFTQEEYDRIKYESPLVKKLRELEVRTFFVCLVIGEDGTRNLGIFYFP